MHPIKAILRVVLGWVNMLPGFEHGTCRFGRAKTTCVTGIADWSRRRNKCSRYQLIPSCVAKTVRASVITYVITIDRMGDTLDSAEQLYPIAYHHYRFLHMYCVKLAASTCRPM